MQKKIGNIQISDRSKILNNKEQKERNYLVPHNNNKERKKRTIKESQNFTDKQIISHYFITVHTDNQSLPQTTSVSLCMVAVGRKQQ
uniref:Uncharacterized protein n=1 Tax=Onchocerca volvulus TaxID=6282 RepID=A0A8R1TUV2_ONCVO